MKQLDGQQLSILAEDDYDYCHYRQHSRGDFRKIELAWEYLDGGQPQTRMDSMGGNGGQIKNSQSAPHLPPTDKRASGGNCPPSIFDKDEGDDGTWIEIDRRNGGDYRYLRWREGKTKKSKYLGKL